MKYKLVRTVFTVLLTLFLSNYTKAQTSNVLWTIQKNAPNTLLFYNIETGTLVSAAVFEQNIVCASVNEEEGIYYAVARNFMYKGELKSGKIIDTYQYMELMEKTKDDTQNPNDLILPMSVTMNGYAIVNFNSKLLEALRKQNKYNDKMISTSTHSEGQKELQKQSDGISVDHQEGGKLAEESIKDSKYKEIYIIDFNNKSKKYFATFNTEETFVSVGYDDGLISLFDKNKYELILKDFVTGEVKNKISYSALFTKHPELSTLTIWALTAPSSDGVTHCLFEDMDVATGKRKYIKTSFNLQTNETQSYEAISFEEFLSYKTYENHFTGETYYSKTDCDSLIYPSYPEFPELEGTSKKKRAEYDEKVKKMREDYQKKTDEYLYQLKHMEDLCTLILYKDKKKAEKIVSIPKTRYGTIVSKDKILIQRANEIVLYDLNGAKVWTIDIIF